MAYNRQYKTRNSGRFNTPGQFVPAAESVMVRHMARRLKRRGAAGGAGAGAAPAPLADPTQLNQEAQFGQESTFQQFNQPPQQNFNNQQQQQQQTPRNNKPGPAQTPQPPLPEAEPEAVKAEPDADVPMAELADDAPARPAWMKYKPGVKKISKKEKRRRQNAHLRRLIAPKNALMVLNEMLLNESITNNFKVEPAMAPGYYKSQNKHSFCADLSLDGQNYKGYGENKLAARNAAAEQAIRDLIIKRLARISSSEASAEESAPGEAVEGEESLPMIQIASFALHKLFSEWEYEGHKVPQIRPLSFSQSSDVEVESLPPVPRPPAVKKPKELPLNARAMHPAMLLSYMRPHVEYRELQVEGDRPQNMVFTVGVDVEGSTYVGKASNKKEARKAAARAACSALFGVIFDDVSADAAPQPPSQAAQPAQTAN